MENGTRGGRVQLERRQNKDMLQVLDLEQVMPEIMKKQEHHFYCYFIQSVRVWGWLHLLVSLHFALPSFGSSPCHVNPLRCWECLYSALTLRTLLVGYRIQGGPFFSLSTLKALFHVFWLHLLLLRCLVSAYVLCLCITSPTLLLLRASFVFDIPLDRWSEDWVSFFLFEVWFLGLRIHAVH